VDVSGGRQGIHTRPLEEAAEACERMMSGALALVLTTGA
jgi:hypothetical protein